MSSKLQRRIKKAALKLQSKFKKRSQLSLESLEQRLLLDVAGYWDELGWRSGSGGGISWDNDDMSGAGTWGLEDGEGQLVISSDGDPVALWIEGTFNEYVDTPIPYHFEMSGSIFARQYADDIGWWDLSQGSGDDRVFGAVNITRFDASVAAAVRTAITTTSNANSITLASTATLAQVSNAIYSSYNTDRLTVYEQSDGSLLVYSPAEQLSIASGPDNQIVAAWIAPAIPDGTDNGTDVEVYAKRWNGQSWEQIAGSAQGGGVSADGVINESPSVVISDLGEIYISYTAIHPVTSQREIVVKRFGYAYDSDSKLVGPPQDSDLSWTELSNKEVGLFGERLISGVSADVASSFDSAIVLDNESRPIVVWSNEYNQGNIEVYLKRWDGDTWSELGLGSASDVNANGLSGVSSDVGMSLQPDLAITDDGQVVVTWVNWADWQN